MQTKSLAIVLLRVVAVLVAAQGFGYIAELASFSQQGQNFSGNVSLAFALALLVPLATGAVIWWVAPYVANLAVNKLPASVEFGGLTAEGLAHAAFVVLGVWLFLSSIPSLVTATFQLFEPNGMSRMPWLIARALRCAFGVALIAGSRRISTVLLRLRYAGTSG